MSVLAIIVAILDILVCLGLIFLVVMQESESKGLGVLGGGADTFFGKQKGRGIDAKLKQLTSYLAIAFAVLTVILYLLTGRGS
jgi:preprotein translocase subunit SecG